MYRGTEPAGRRRAGVIGMRWQQQHLNIVVWIQRHRRCRSTAAARRNSWPAARPRKRTRSNNSSTPTSMPARASRLDYNANGSGAGVTAFRQQRNRSGGFRQAVEPGEGSNPTGRRERCGSPAWDLPAVFGPIAVTYNIDGVSSLNLDGPTTAKIFNGSITTWNDPAIKALNAEHQPARDADQRRLPQRQIRHHIQLPEVPRGRIRRRVGQRHRRDVRWGCRSGRQWATRARRRPLRAHRRVDHLQRVVVRGGPSTEHCSDRDVRGSGSGDDHHRLGRQDDRRGQVCRARQ